MIRGIYLWICLVTVQVVTLMDKYQLFIILSKWCGNCINGFLRAETKVLLFEQSIGFSKAMFLMLNWLQ